MVTKPTLHAEPLKGTVTEDSLSNERLIHSVDGHALCEISNSQTISYL